MIVDLADLRRTFALPFAVLIGLVGAVALLVALFDGADWPVVAVIATLATVAALLLCLREPDGLTTRWTTSVLLMLQVALLLYATAGTTYQADLHMGFFAALAISAFWLCPTTILLSTVFVASHHLVLNFVHPAWVFPNGAELARVVMHGAILLVEAAALILMTRSLSRMIRRSNRSIEEARRSPQAQHEAERRQQALEHEVKEAHRQTEDIAIAAVGLAVAAARNGDFTGRFLPDADPGRLSSLVDGLSQMNEIIDGATADLLAVLSAVSEGDLTRRVENDHQGRFEDLRQAINHTVERLSQTVSTIQATAQDVGTTTRDIHAGASDLSSRTERQTSSLEATAATAEELAASVKATALASGHAAELAREAMTVAVDAGAIVREAGEAMGRIEEASKRITEITDIIDDIAFQTNLLALNAAVEAARAGDAGKGFAVVASEVRTLAQSSGQAARDIAELISASAAEVSQGVRLVRGTGDVLDRIVESSRKVSTTVEDISQATGEQAKGIDELTRAVAAIDGMTQQNAALAEKSAGSATSLADQIERLNALTASFRTADAQPSARLQLAVLR